MNRGAAQVGSTSRAGCWLGVFALCGWGLLGVAEAADLSVSVTDLRSDRGQVHIALYDKAETFPDGDGMIAEIEAPITGRTARHTFTNLPPASYAIAVYHDENGNDDFDTNVIGLPLEGYAFSSGATAFLGPPLFADARFELTPPTTEISIPMTY